MKLPFQKVVNNAAIVLSIAMLLCSSCKKQIIEVPVDPFLDLRTELKHEDEAYTLSFRLQDYSYKDVGLMLTLDRNAFFTRYDLSNCETHEMAKNHYKSYLNVLKPNSTYYYQLYVKDTKSSKEVYSDVYSFKTMP